MHRIARRFALAAGVLALGTLRSPAARAQGATLRGRVVDSELGEGIHTATIRIKPGGATIPADSAGRFEAADLKAGEIEITVTAPGFENRSWKMTLQPGQIVERTFSVDFTGEKLPEVVVTARAEKLMPRYLDFERRRTKGLGAFMRWDEIKRKNFATVGEAMRTVRGVRLQCNQQEFECFIRMARTPNCNPTWYVDGVQVASFHENTPIRDVYGLEMYRGASELPAEFSGSEAACGVLVVWTKSKPFH